MRIAALFFGLVAGLFALLAPSAMHSELMAQFMALWSDTPTDKLIGTAIWYGIPAAAILGALLATVVPGLAVIPLVAAALGWAGIGLALGKLADYELIAPAAVAGLAALLSLLAAELAVRRRRMARRRRRSLADDGGEGDEIEREAALRDDPPSIDRTAAPPARRVVPLDIGDIATTTERPAGPPPRWQDLDPPAPRQGRPDIWGEAIRPQPDYVVEPEPLSPEPAVHIEQEPTRGFRWDRADAPTGQGFDGGRGGPRLVRRSTVDAIPERAPARVPEPPRPAPSPAPEPLRAPAEFRSEPPARERWTPPRDVQRRGSGLVAALWAVIAVLVLGALLAGGYLAYRDGWVDRLIAMVQPQQQTGTTPATVAEATGAGPELPQQVLGEPTAPSPQPAAIAVLPSKPAVSAEAATGATPAALTQLPSSPTFNDPFAYCSAVSTVDYVDDRYRGPMVTPAMTSALDVPDKAARDRVHWRCANGMVMACASYIGPVCDMAPSTAEMREYCAQYPAAPQLMAPGGVWSCTDGRPQLPADAKWLVDARGFRTDTWVVVSPQPAPSG